MGGIGYITEFSLELFTLHPDFITSTWTMNILTAGDDDIISESGVTISSITSEPVSAVSYTNQSLSLIVDDLYYQNLDQSVSFSENYDMQITLNLSCPITSTSSILYSITEYNGNTIPSWVSINSSSGVLKVSAPEVSITTAFNFYIISTITGIVKPIQKLIKLTIFNCEVENCFKCSTSDVSICVSCLQEYNLFYGTCVPKPTSSAKAMTTVTQSATGTTAAVVSAFSMINTSSLSSLWSIVNQLQLFFLLLLTRAFIPEDVKNSHNRIKIVR